MEFEFNKALEILERTPLVIKSLLSGASEVWTLNNEGENTWSPYDVIGHLVHGEKTDWIPRLEMVLNTSETKTFEPYDRFAQFEMSKGKNIATLLSEFEMFRKQNLDTLRSKNISEKDLNKTANHPSLGIVTLKNLLAAWVVHDLGHIAQISRVMAKQYKDEICPWTQYLTIVNHTPKE
ncbi:MAG: DinB family protein [Flavobacteriaceae bacterium]